MIWSRLFLVVVFSCHFFATSLDKSNVISEDKAAYIQLVQLQAKYCDTLNICSLKSDATNNLIGTSHKMCCTDCSCDLDCARRGDCCLDYYLVDILNGSIYSDVTDFISVLDNVTNADGLTIPDTFIPSSIGNNDTDTSTANDKVQCSKTSIFPTIKSTRIKMIAKCPHWFTNVSIKGQCMDGGTYDEIKSKRFLDIVPVTSMETGIVFKNIYCFRCHAKPNETASHWSVIYEVNPNNPYIETFLGDVEQLLATLFTDEGKSNNIRFVPPNTEIVLSRIEQCSVTETIDCALEIGADITRACRMFHSHVAYVTGRVKVKQPDGTIFKHSYVTLSNIACSRCSYFEGSQQCTDIEPLQLMINNRQDTDKPKKQKSRSALNLYFSTSCGHGYIYDGKEVLCRRVECPIYWENESGNCVPMFSHIYNGIFSMYLLVEVRLSSNSAKERDTFESLMSTVFEIMIKLLFGDKIPTYGLSVWKYPHQDGYNSKYFVNFHIESNNVFFVDALKILSTFLQNTKALMKLHEFETKVSITSEVVPSRNQDFRGIVLLRTDERLSLSWTNNVTIPRGIPVPLSRTHLCYRVFLNIADHYERVSRHYFASKRTGVLVTETSLQSVNKNTVVDCIDNVMPVTDQILYINLDIAKPKFPLGEDNKKNERRNGSIEDEPDSVDQRGILGLAAFVVIVIIVVVLAKLRSKLQRSHVG